VEAISRPVLVSILGILATVASKSVFAQTWTETSAPVTNWSCIAMSADGTRLVAGVGRPYAPGPIFVSTNSGSNWSQAIAPILGWRCMASSADGRKFAAVAEGDGVYTSEDAGATWTKTSAPQASWQTVASSADGLRLAVGETNTTWQYGLIHTSTNGGASWQISGAPSYPWLSVATSSDGGALIAVGYHYRLAPGRIFASTNRGVTWFSPTAGDGWGGGDSPSFATCSSDGTKLAVAALGSIGTSTNGGINWEEDLFLGGTPPYLTGMAASADGTKLLAVANFTYSDYSGMYLSSTNAGIDWNQVPALKTNWNGVACSADGCKAVAVVMQGGIYTLQTKAHPVLELGISGNELVLVWIIPSMPFMLQQSYDLTGTWSNVSVTPSLNFGKLQYQVRLPRPFTTMYYRLVSR
jgi:photosystem II stability/assembly factor-like uncharacterized protein